MHGEERDPAADGGLRRHGPLPEREAQRLQLHPGGQPSLLSAPGRPVRELRLKGGWGVEDPGVESFIVAVGETGTPFDTK